MFEIMGLFLLNRLAALLLLVYHSIIEKSLQETQFEQNHTFLLMLYRSSHETCYIVLKVYTSLNKNSHIN